MDKFKLQIVGILLVILVLILGSATKLKTARNIKLSGAVSGNVNFDGSKDVIINTTQANIAVIIGKINLTANTQENLQNNMTKQTIWNVKYPDGYNKENCIIIDFAGNTTESSGYGSGYLSSNNTAIALLTGTLHRIAVLNTDNISCQAFNPATTTKTFNYKIVLMKVL